MLRSLSGPPLGTKVLGGLPLPTSVGVGMVGGPVVCPLLFAQVSSSVCSPSVQEAAGAVAAEVMPLMRKTRRHGSNRAHPGKVLKGTLVVAPSGCKSWAQVSVPPLL